MGDDRVIVQFSTGLGFTLRRFRSLNEFDATDEGACGCDPFELDEVVVS